MQSYGLIINVRRQVLVGDCGPFVADGRTGMQRFRSSPIHLRPNHCMWVGMCGQGEGDGEFQNSEVC